MDVVLHAISTIFTKKAFDKYNDQRKYMSQTRQLAAIMFTDIVGYTALMGNDEKKAFELLSKNRQIQKPIIEKYNGKWVKEMGDGVMASFNTVSDAVNAAMKIQEECNRVKKFQLKIGMHLGEVKMMMCMGMV